jgi:hypothetical protein
MNVFRVVLEIVATSGLHPGSSCCILNRVGKDPKVSFLFYIFGKKCLTGIVLDMRSYRKPEKGKGKRIIKTNECHLQHFVSLFCSILYFPRMAASEGAPKCHNILQWMMRSTFTFSSKNYIE